MDLNIIYLFFKFKESPSNFAIRMTRSGRRMQNLSDFKNKNKINENVKPTERDKTHQNNASILFFISFSFFEKKYL